MKDYGREYVRLADRILAAKNLRPPAWWVGVSPSEVERHHDWLRKAIPQSEVILIDNVAEYFYAGTDQEEWDVGSDFPCIAPPFPAFWMEYKAPSKIVSSVHGIQNHTRGVELYGFLFSVVDGQDREAIKRMMSPGTAEEKQSLERSIAYYDERCGTSLREKLQGQKIPDPQEARDRLGLTTEEMSLLSRLITWDTIYGRGKGLHLDSGDVDRLPRWVMRAIGYLGGDGVGGVLGPFSCWDFQINTDGSLWQDGALQQWGLPVPLGCRTPNVADFAALNPAVFPCLMALTFMHCKNVTVAPGQAPPMWSERQERRHGQPLVKFKTLNIQAMTAVIKQSRDALASGGGRISPLHICRGHFKDYRERGLFGKHKGIYWWDNYVRGQIERGVVFKDYSMN